MSFLICAAASFLLAPGFFRPVVVYAVQSTLQLGLGSVVLRNPCTQSTQGLPASVHRLCKVCNPFLPPWN
jgi:hypothetical protein